MTSVIFGANGQDGFYLSQLLKDKGIEVIGVSRSGEFLKTDLSNYEQVASLIKQTQPAYAFHLAANSTTRHEALFENHETISTGTLNILEAVKNHSPQTKVFISGSGLQFQNNNVPIKETDPFEAGDAYSVSRIHSVYAARYFRIKHHVQTYVGYLYNHDSPRRSERHMAKKIAEAAKRIAGGFKETLTIGDVAAVKEWAYAEDIVKGIWTLVNQDAIFEANIGSGIGHSIEEWLSLCFEYFALDWKDYVKPDNNFVPDYKMLVCDPAVINSLGWKADTDFRTLAQMMLE